MEFRVVDDRGRAGFSWVALEPTVRTSHALVADGRVWFVDPVDWPDGVDRAAELGRPAGVIQLLDRHNRDSARLAEHLGIPHVRLPAELPGSPFTVIDLVRAPRWREVALWWESQATLVVSEAIGAGPFFTVGSDRLGVHGLLKPVPPRRKLGGLRPEHVLVGHGAGVHGSAAALELDRALGRSRLRFLSWLAGIPTVNGRAGRYVEALRGADPPA